MTIKIKNIHKSFGEVLVFRNFSACIEEGNHYYMKGPSGCGKTTLMRILMGLETIDSGEIIGLEDYKVSIVFQENRLLESLSSLENIRLVSKKSEAVILEALQRFGLTEFEYAPINTLSGGMKRRVAILRALLCDYNLLLLDEPFKGLDDEIKDTVIQEIKQQTKRKTVVLVTHAKEEATALGIVEKNHIMH